MRKDWKLLFVLAVVECIFHEVQILSVKVGLQVFAVLQAPAPTFHYAPLVMDAHGEKLSKRDRSAGLKALIDQGCDALDVIGQLAFGLGLVPHGTRCSVQELLDR